MINLGVLVTYMPSSPAVGVRRSVGIRVPTEITAYGVAVREMRFCRLTPARGPIPVILHRHVVTDILRVPALAFVYCVTVVDARLQLGALRTIICETRHAV